MTKLPCTAAAVALILLAMYPPAVAQSPATRKKLDVQFVPTPQMVVDEMLELAEVTDRDIVYDLGCGDGVIVVSAAMLGARAAGYDIDPQRVRQTRSNIRKHRLEERAKVFQRDIFTLDLSGADVVTLYLLPALNERLIPQLEQLKPGSRIVSHDFAMKGVTPRKVVKVAGPRREHTLYLWVTPLVKEEP